MKRLTVVATAVLTLGASGASLNAQVTEVSRTQLADAAQLTFGHLCDDRFVIRNDGMTPADLEYGVERGTEHTRLTLNARESVELASTSKRAVELWMDGKPIAKAEKQRVSCKQVQGNAAVTVAPLQVTTTTPSRPMYAYDSTYPYYDPWGYGYYGYGSLGFRPYYSRFVSRPIIIRRAGHARRSR